MTQALPPAQPVAGPPLWTLLCPSWARFLRARSTFLCPDVVAEEVSGGRQLVKTRQWPFAVATALGQRGVGRVLRGRGPRTGGRDRKVTDVSSRRGPP